MTDHEQHSWAAELRRHEKPHSLISIARQGRLVREGPNIGQRVHINAVDECVLTLVDLARSKHRNICILYPAPAGDVSVLLAAQLLLQALLQQASAPRVGLLTADVVGAARAWHELRIAAGPTRTALSEAFPCIRATPEGRSPLEDRQFKGVIVGNRFSHWPVGFIIVDHLAGFVSAETPVPMVHIFADPLDPTLEAMASAGELIWGFAPSELLRDGEIDASGDSQFSPFSVAEDRLRVIRQGVHSTIEAVRHTEAESCVTRIRDDLKTLTELCGPSPARSTAKGLRVAWQHFTTLLCLPCQPHVFDQFAGLPPIAARATTTFEPEISAWSRTLGGDAGEFGSVLASDLGELRAILNDCNLFLPQIVAAAESSVPTLCVVRTHTAARALMHIIANDSEADHVGNLHVRSIRRLNREASWPRTIVVGLLPKWEWHRIDSGLAPDLRVLVLGSTEVRIAESMLIATAKFRTRWASTQVRGSALRELFGTKPPADDAPGWLPTIAVVSTEISPELDPLSHFHSLAASSPLLVGDEGVEEVVAEESETGAWAAAVDAVDVFTNSGKITLAANRPVEVRQGDRILDCVAESLQPGVYLLIGRREGRLGLLEAMAERLQKTRPDLFAATLLVSDLREAVRRGFRSKRVSISELHEQLATRGFDKTYQAVRGYVAEVGPLAPRDVADLRMLNEILVLGFSSRRIDEIFAGVRRLRIFRRGAGRALAAAARESTVASDTYKIDKYSGLSLADLREIVVEAKVLGVKRRPNPVPISELNRMEQIE